MLSQPEMSMGNQSSRSGVGESTKSTIRMPRHVSQKRIPTESHSMESEPPRGHKRPFSPPERQGVERREIVLEEIKRATAYFDLTGDADGQPALKIRRVGRQKIDTAKSLRKDAASHSTTPPSKNESPRTSNLVDYASSSSRSPETEDSEKIQTDGRNAKITRDAIKNTWEEESDTDNTSELQPRPENMPFVDEGYGSFTTSQEWEKATVELAEADLAEHLINSDKLRSSGAELDVTSNKDARPNTLNLITQNAIAWKEKIEREGAEKSRALREVAKKQNGSTVEQQRSNTRLEVSPKPQKYTSQEVGILSMFGRVEETADLSHVGCRASNSSASTRTNSGGSSTVSSTDYSNEDDVESGGDDDEEDLFCESRDSTTTIEITPGTQEDIELDTTNNQPKSPRVATAYSRDNDTQGRGTSEEAEPHPSTTRLGHPVLIEIEDLEAGARKLEAYTKFNERQKAGPKTLFTTRHKLDTLNRSYQHSTDSSPPSRQKCYSPYGESVRRASNPSRRPEGANETQGLAQATPKADVLSRAPNRDGALAILAQKATLESGAPLSNPPFTSTIEHQIGGSNRTYQSTTVSASEFHVDFSRYTHQLNQEERDIITRHEWLKERQRDLKALKATYTEAARLSCITGVTKRMEEELSKIDEFNEIVLEQGKSDKAKRNRLQAIKGNMVSRQTHDVPIERLEENLGLFIDRRSLQILDNELKNVEGEMESVGNKRLEMSTKRGMRTARSNRKKKARFASPDADGGASRPRSRSPDVTVVDLCREPKVARPKVGTEEYRQSRLAAYCKSQAQRETALREKLMIFDEPTIKPSAGDAGGVGAAAQATNAGGEDVQSEVSEEDEGCEMYVNIESAFARPATVSKPSQKTSDVSLEEMNTLDEDRKRQEVLALPKPMPKAADRAPAFAQAPDLAVAEQMRRAHLGIPEQDEAEILSDVESDKSGDSNGSEIQMVNNYVVYGRYTGVAELEDCAKYRLGRFLKKNNAETLIGEKVVEFCDARKRDIMEATAAEDEGWLARLGDPEAGTLKHDMKTKEQVLEFPASSCCVWMEMERVEARSRAEREAVVSTNTYVALYQRTMPDGSTETPSWDELVTCSGPNGVWLANREACRIMSDWYEEHMKDGYLAMQRDALEEKVRDLGDEGLFDEEETFLVAGSKESMKVWVDWKRNRG